MSDEFKYLLVTIEYEPFAHLGRSVVRSSHISLITTERFCIIAFELIEYLIKNYNRIQKPEVKLIKAQMLSYSSKC